MSRIESTIKIVDISLPCWFTRRVSITKPEHHLLWAGAPCRITPRHLKGCDVPRMPIVSCRKSPSIPLWHLCYQWIVLPSSFSICPRSSNLICLTLMLWFLSKFGPIIPPSPAATNTTWASQPRMHFFNQMLYRSSSLLAMLESTTPSGTSHPH